MQIWTKSPSLFLLPSPSCASWSGLGGLKVGPCGMNGAHLTCARHSQALGLRGQARAGLKKALKWVWRGCQVSSTNPVAPQTCSSWAALLGKETCCEPFTLFEGHWDCGWVTRGHLRWSHVEAKDLSTVWMLLSAPEGFLPRVWVGDTKKLVDHRGIHSQGIHLAPVTGSTVVWVLIFFLRESAPFKRPCADICGGFLQRDPLLPAGCGCLAGNQCSALALQLCSTAPCLPS